MEVRRFETQWGGKTLQIETGKLAGQASGSCTVRYGDSVVLATATMSHFPREGVSFFPLSVEYQEKMYASGKIKGSRFVKREGRPTDGAIITSRMIDRCIRPLFPKGVRHEVQVVGEVLSADLENPTDILALVGASCALAISPIPWGGPVGGIRIGRVGGEWVINPTFEAQQKSDVDLIVSGMPDRVLMIEANAREVSEDDMKAAITFAEEHLKEPLALIAQVVEAVGKEKVEAASLMSDADLTDEERAEREQLVAKSREFVEGKLDEVLFSGPKVSKAERRAAIDKLKDLLDDHLKEQQIGKDKRKIATEAFEGLVEHAVTDAILSGERRVDGRTLTQIRTLTSEVGLLPRTHGSGLFSRGETQILSTVTLGAPSDYQVIDSMEQDVKVRYFHHYNFPPYSVGETGRIGSPGRREIGHGGLAERALLPVLPDKEDFPYAIRVVSECLSSNGSSSQGSICGSTLALMDAGVPIKAPVAGIAMGLSSNDDMSRWKVLTDLQDVEDGPGGMDFKIGGTRKGIVTIQLDTKTKGLNDEIISKTLDQGKDARFEILDVMEAAIAEPRKELSPFAPRIETLHINPERIRDVIGPGGKMINQIIDETGVSMDVENDGTVTICSNNGPAMKKAVDWVKLLTKEVEVGEIFENGKVTRLMDFGAFVEVAPNKEGLVHISQLAPWRVEKVSDMVNVGDVIPVKVIEIDDLGRINLSHKEAMKALGREQTPPSGVEMRPSGGFGRGGDRGPRHHGNDRHGGGRPHHGHGDHH